MQRDRNRYEGDTDRITISVTSKSSISEQRYKHRDNLESAKVVLRNQLGTLCTASERSCVYYAENSVTNLAQYLPRNE